MTAAITDRPRQAAHGSPGKIKTAMASAAGTCVENYDFVAYGTAAALYFGKVFFPNTDPVVGTLLALRYPRGGLPDASDRRSRRRLPRRQVRPQARARRRAADHGHRHRPDRLPPHVRAGRHPRTHPARHHPDDPGPGVRRGMGRRRHDDVRARTLEEARALRRHPAGGQPAGHHPGQRRVPALRLAADRLGLAAAVPRQLRPDRRRPGCPDEAGGIPRVRAHQGHGCHRQEPAYHRDQGRLAEHPARDLPADRGELRVLRHGHIPALLHHEEQPRRPGHRPHRHCDRQSSRHPGHARRRRTHRPHRPSQALPRPEPSLSSCSASRCSCSATPATRS